MKPKKKICSNPNCIHAGKEQLETNFYKSGERRRSQCKDCEKAKKVVKAIPEKVVSKPKKKTEIKPELIRCHTKAEYDSLMKIYEKKGWERLAGQKPTEYDARSENKKQGNTGYISIQIEDSFCRGAVDSTKFDGLPYIDFKNAEDTILNDLLEETKKEKKTLFDTSATTFANGISPASKVMRSELLESLLKNYDELFKNRKYSGSIGLVDKETGEEVRLKVSEVSRADVDKFGEFLGKRFKKAEKIQKKSKAKTLWILFLIGYGIGSTLFNVLGHSLLAYFVK